jgi:peptidoglycan/xylan/chitin deacetylase (PgdA/CDA1 family)
MRLIRLGITLAVLAAMGWWQPVQAADSAVVVMYHRFGDGRYPTTNIRLDQFEAHLRELKAGGHVVLPLPKVVEAMRTGAELPDKAVAITIDDAWSSVYRYAWPRLKALGIPFTLFVVTDETDRGGPEMMTWDQIRELAASGLVTIGTQGAAHPHMAGMSRRDVTDDLARARRRLAEELGGKLPELLAWPFGEASAEAQAAAREAGFTAAFGQHSGVVWPRGDHFHLPRFALNETYGEPARFRLAVRALPLRAVDLTPSDPLLAVNPPAFGFTLATESPEDVLVTCYASHEGQVRHEHLGPRIEVRLSKPFPSGRGRVNCTAPALDGRWRWFGWQFAVP